MSDLEKHEMNFEKQHPSGAEEWACPICGRRMLISWEPKFRRAILETGDQNVIHGGVRIRIPVVGNLNYPFIEEPPSYEYVKNTTLEVDESSLGPWSAWMKGTGFDDLWTKDIR